MPDIDLRLEAVVNRMFDNCLESGQYKQAIGIAIETQRLDVLEKAIRLTVRHILKCAFLAIVLLYLL